ncbi:hypothetical protein [uncultured Bacteroides sp.]|uniref:hypothetical protein n=1 Tax=uncultured Bacteroides sp. TaxID=162156 RepID=UPI002AA654DC|nr:hypothetical protein [uncultured Bacteroides sp.]
MAWSLMILGGVEAVWGLRQLFSFSVSGHLLYNLIGSFYNPGPYGGYLAMVDILTHKAFLINMSG